ncbi:MAG TPA: hypothetical protein VJ731_17010 [Terriglobales bacterium]|nr:hypothetical protein [Terriglobales bacterium]
MANRWEQATDGYSFRYFSPEEVDEMLRDGARRGRQGSHCAIERVLKHEPELRRSDLWQRIRRLKQPAGPRSRTPFLWSSEDEEILRNGYNGGWQEKRKAISYLLKRHPEWRPHVIWQHARKNGLVRKFTKRGQERSGTAWSDEDNRVLLDLAGYKRVRVIAKMLHRSEAAIRYQLAILGESSRTHREGFARTSLARDLHFSTKAIQRLITEGLLEVRDPRITRESLDSLRRAGTLEAWRKNGTKELLLAEQTSQCGTSAQPEGNSGECQSAKPSRGKRVWAEVAASLQVTQKMAESLIASGVLKLYDPTITEESLRRFCRRYGSLIEYDFLNRETREWLQSSLDWAKASGQPSSVRFVPLRKHARVVHKCKGCGREIRGNAFFRHFRICVPGRSPDALR